MTHRDRFLPHVRAALATLDRVAEGNAIRREDVERALEVTGDLQRATLADAAPDNGSEP